MRVAHHPALSHIKQDKWASVHLATGKFKPAEWTKADQQAVQQLLPPDITTLGQPGVSAILKKLYFDHKDTWCKFTWFARRTHADMPRALANAARSNFCAYCHSVFPRKDVCADCYSKFPEAVALSRKLGAASISDTWQSKSASEKAKKGQKIRDTRAAWSDERKAEIRSTLKASAAKVDKEARLRKMAATHAKRYGVANPSQRPEVLNKKRTGQLAKHGVEHHSQRPEVAAKMRAAWADKDEAFYKQRTAQSAATYKQRTGYTHNMRNPEVIERRISDSLESWGVENPASSPEVRDRINDKWERKYGYREVFASPEVRAKIRSTLMARYGVENPMGHAPFIKQIQEYRRSPIVYNGKTYYVDSSLEADCFVRLKQKYGTVYTQYSNQYPATLTWLPDFYVPCIDRYVEVKGVYTLLHGNGGTSLIRNREKAKKDKNCEWMVCESGRWVRLPKDWEHLRFVDLSRFLAEKCHHSSDFVSDVATKVFAGMQHSIDGNYIRSTRLTIFCATLTQHNSDLVPRSFLKEVRDSGALILWDYEWNLRRTAVKKYLANQLGTSKFSIGARSTTVSVSKVTDTDAKFFQVNHLQGKPRRGICVRLSVNDRVVAAMVFTSVQSVRGTKAEDGVYELIRFATVGRIHGAASKLFTAFVRQYKPTRILSYSDSQHFSGGVYKTLGFEQTKCSGPDYRTIWSFVDYVTLSKQASRRSNLSKIPGFDASKSEGQNLDLLGLPKIYDCGKVKWEWVNDAE